MTDTTSLVYRECGAVYPGAAWIICDREHGHDDGDHTMESPDDDGVFAWSA